MGWPASSKTRASSRPMAFGPVGAWPMFGISFACALAEESFCAAATPQRAAMISVTRNSLRIFYSPKTSWWRFMMRDYRGAVLRTFLDAGAAETVARTPRLELYCFALTFGKRIFRTPIFLRSPHMRRTLVSLLLTLTLLQTVMATQTNKPTPAPTIVLIKAGRMVDTRAGRVVENQGILVEGERIKAVGPFAQMSASAPNGVRVIDLSHATVLPGLTDCHVHILLQGDITAADYDEQLLKESIPYRTIRATVAARTGLMNGFTAMRDLETEGAMYADVDVKTAINRGIIPGPRMFVSTRAMSTTGTYPLLGYSWELKMPEGVQIVDGPEDIRKAVREEAKYGADWIKFYADRRYYVGADGRLRSWVNFTDEELKMLVSEAHRLGKKVAAHAMGWDGIDAALRAGVNTIEHGDGLTDDLLDRMVAQKVYWCPTIFVGVYVAPGRGGIWPKMVDLERIAFGKGLKKSVMI